MAPRKKLFHEQLAENLEAQKNGQNPPHKDAEEEARSKFEKLNDKAVQQSIMDPNGTKIDLSYSSITVYPLTMRDKRRAGGFLSQVSADLAHSTPRSQEEAMLRTASLLMRREDLEQELFRICAIACFKTGSLVTDVSPSLEKVAEFQEKCDSSDILVLFGVLTDLADFKAPKT